MTNTGFAFRRRVPQHPVAAALLLVGLASSAPARADLADSLYVEPWTARLAPLDVTLGGWVNGALYRAHQPGGPSWGAIDETNVTGQMRIDLSIARLYDSGLEIGFKSTYLPYYDTLSNDRFGNNAVQRAYFYVSTGLGTVQLGQQTGAGAALGFTGPKVDEHVSLDNPDTSLFFDPAAGERFDAFFRPFSAVDATGVSTKLTYLSPRLLGLALGLSFTPNLSKGPLPFIANPADRPNRQHNLPEIAVSYQDNFSGIDVGLSAAFLHGQLSNRTDGYHNLAEWALGGEAATDMFGGRLQFGVAYRASNAYAFNPFQAVNGAHSRLVHLSLMEELDQWRFGAEYSTGAVEGPSGYDDFGVNAYQVSTSYRLNMNARLSAGWQWYDYDRDAGAFYNGAGSLAMNGGFLNLTFAIQ